MSEKYSTGPATAGAKPTDRVSTIARVLEHNIQTGHYQPGDRLPSEADLCRHFDVSRPTLREALGRLSAMGLLQSRRGAGGGAFVTRPDPQELSARIATQIALGTDGPDQALEMMEARVQLLAGCARLAAQRRAPIDDLRAEIDRQSDFSVDDAAFRASCRRMYHALSMASGNTVLAALTRALIEAEAARGPVPPSPTRARARFLSFHVRLANAIAAGRAEESDSALTDLLAYEMESLRQPATEDSDFGAERPPRMRDMRIPPVQRLDETDPGT
ncbi:MAG: FadR family transcriptional regulator [Pararhodobacter sp.]|nr:FadR family transcriptional regulator [Pararhodobacter sp.]